MYGHKQSLFRLGCVYYKRTVYLEKTRNIVILIETMISVTVTSKYIIVVYLILSTVLSIFILGTVGNAKFVNTCILLQTFLLSTTYSMSLKLV